MKKIIYSLVIMIAAGSLFTSCIEQVEPLGIQDMRFAKAEYIRALKDLRAADAEYVRAQAAVEQANARFRDAQTAVKNAEAEMQKLKNEYQALVNEAKADSNEYNRAQMQFKIDSLAMKMEELQAQHDSIMVAAEQALAEAQEKLRVALRNIALASQDLTDKEKAAVFAAVEAYEEAYKLYVNQLPKVMAAERKVDSLKWAKENFADKDWDISYLEYRDKVTMWEEEKEYWLAWAEYDYYMYMSIPETAEDFIADLAEWKATLDELEQKMVDAEYALHEFTEEVTNYYVQFIHDGWEGYNKEVEQWEYDHPGVPNPGDAPKYTAGQKSYTIQFAKEVKVGTTKYVKGDVVGNGSTGIISKMPTLEKGGTAAYTKLEALLDSYKQDNPDTEAADKIIDVVGGKFVINAGSAMKDFILGTEDGDVDTQKYVYDKKNNKFILASYGLNGAVATLKRDKVLNPETPADPAKAKEAMDKAAATWQADLDTLTAGIAGYEFYKTALADLDATRADYATGKSDLFAAVKALYKVLNDLDVAGAKTYSKNDSTAILGAIEAYAAARDSYLDDFNKYAKGTNPHYFYFGTAKTSAGLVVDSVAFSEIASQTKFAVKNYEYVATGDNLVERTFSADATKKGVYSALANILDQLFPGKNMGTAINVASGAAINLNAATVMAPATELVVGAKDANGDPVSYKVDSWEKPTALTPANYEPSAITDAKDEVLARVAQFVKIYNRFWAETIAVEPLPTTITDAYATYFTKTKAADKAKALTNSDGTGAEDQVAKTLAKKVKYTVKTFTEPYFNVVFDGDDILFTEAMGVILGSVENGTPSATGSEFNDGGKVKNTASIFFGPDGTTKFYKYMKAMWAYEESLKPSTTSIAEIEEWVEAVAARFDSAADGDSALVYTVYQADSTAYEALKAAYTQYVADLEAFTGGKAKNGYIIKKCANYSDPEKFFNQNTWVISFNLAGKDIFDEFDGKWADDKDIDGFVLGGEQLKLAEKYFPGLPAKLKEWEQKLDQLVHDYQHAEIAYDNFSEVYLLAAQAKGYEGADTADDFDEWVENVQDYLDDLRGDWYFDYIMDYLEANDYAKMIADYYGNEGGLFDIAIAKAEAELKIAQAYLEEYEKAMNYAKANLDRILEYLKSLDVNFVIPTSYDK